MHPGKDYQLNKGPAWRIDDNLFMSSTRDAFDCINQSAPFLASGRGGIFPTRPVAHKTRASNAEGRVSLLLVGG